jgi:hypothetical protein
MNKTIFIAARLTVATVLAAGLTVLPPLCTCPKSLESQQDLAELERDEEDRREFMQTMKFPERGGCVVISVNTSHQSL